MRVASAFLRLLLIKLHFRCHSHFVLARTLKGAIRMDSKKNEDAIALVVDALAHDYDLTETGAARIALMSTSHFRHEFTRITGSSFRMVRLQAKVARGRFLLGTTNWNIPAISAMLGYSDRTKFDKAFKRVYGYSPTLYRRMFT